MKKILEILKNNIKQIKTSVFGILTILIALGVITSNIPAIQESTDVILSSLSAIAGAILVIIAKD